MTETAGLYALVVVRAFGPHAPGDQICDPDGVAAVLAGEHAGAVVRVLLPAATQTQEG